MFCRKFLRRLSLKAEMRCNACWRELEGRAISTTCGHLLCIHLSKTIVLCLAIHNNISFRRDFVHLLSLTAQKGMEDANKILNNDAACPICDQVLSKSLMKPVDINPNDEWINMAMAGISPQTLMKSAYKSVMFFIGQKEFEMQYKMNKVVAQCRQKCETMQEKFTEKLEQVYTAYQKMAKRCQMMEQETESLSKDNQELQEKFSEKSRQKRKLDEMYDQLRSEYESMKRSAIQPASNFYSRAEPDLFASPANMMDNRDPLRKDRSVCTPETPGMREDIWHSTRQKSSNSGPFDISRGSPVKQAPNPVDTVERRAGAHPLYGAGVSNPSMTLRNLILSPMKRPQLSRNRPQMFTYDLASLQLFTFLHKSPAASYKVIAFHIKILASSANAGPVDIAMHATIRSIDEKNNFAALLIMVASKLEL
ncbi:hypothetical protein HHK36_023466 [Tetracentron sinense]|uniref:Uncharacterized protein n=1 Tax=Tetracentron sinense TaxID=13715 RepID=A0A834YNS4_TETSI|nr:hypothetical protein HHK36_023466 [Tetracentron sinense]